MRKAVSPAAGFGTRFLPFTKAVPKEMIPLIDKPVIQYVVEEAVAAGLTEILIIISGGKMAIQDTSIRNSRWSSAWKNPARPPCWRNSAQSTVWPTSIMFISRN